MRKLFLLIVVGVLFAVSCTDSGVDEHKERQILLSQSQMTFDFEGGEGAFTVTADCTWGATCKADWVKFIQTDGTIGESTLKFSVSRNTSIKERSATMIVTNGAYANIAKEVQIIQSGYVPTLEVVESISLEGLACEEVVEITSDVEYTVSDDAAWLSCEIIAEGIRIVATANPNRDTRRATVSICAKEDGSVLRRITVSQVTGTGIYTICYTSTDGRVVTPCNTTVFGANIISNTYENGQGVISFDGPVSKIGYRAFYGCTSLTSVTIPDSVTETGDWAFYGCNALKSVYINNLSAWCKIDFVEAGYACPCYYGAKLYLNGVELTKVTIPSDITEIGAHTFCECSSLTSVTIPDSVTEIGSGAFYNCEALTSVTFGNGVTSIGDSAFHNCTSLTSVTIPDSVTSIGDSAFVYCDALTSVTIGNSVTSIGNSAFVYCDALTSLYCRPTTPPTIGRNYLDGLGITSNRVTIYVPKASVTLYKKAEIWSRLADYIVGTDF